MSDEEILKVCAEVECWIREKAHTAALLKSADPEIVSTAVDCFESHLGAGLFLISPAYGLGGRIPLKVAETPQGKQEVMELIGRIDRGVY